MTRTLARTAAAAALSIALVPLAAAPVTADEHDDDRIDLPVGWQPEGVTTDGRWVYSGSLATGEILRANPDTGATKILRRSKTGKPAVGIDYDRWRPLIWVAGGPTGEIRAQHARTGRVLATYTLPSANGRFVNDLVVTKRWVYATDSFNQELARVPLRPDAIPRSRQVKTLPLTGDIEFQAGEFNANGIVKSGRWLVIVQSTAGKLFRVDRRTGETRELDLDGYSVTNGDGLEKDGRTLYVVRNRINLVAVLELSRSRLKGELVDELTNDNLDVPTTVALVDGDLWAANARFGNPDPANADYWLAEIEIGEDDD